MPLGTEVLVVAKIANNFGHLRLRGHVVNTKGLGGGVLSLKCFVCFVVSKMQPLYVVPQIGSGKRHADFPE